MARIPSSVGTRKRPKEMFTGDTGEIDTSLVVRQAVRLMIEEALEAEVSERLGRGYYEGGKSDPVFLDSGLDHNAAQGGQPWTDRNRRSQGRHRRRLTHQSAGVRNGKQN